MLGACRLNNKTMRNIRRDPVYQCLVLDLTMLGAMSKEDCEMLLGAGMPSGLVLPNGKNFTMSDAESAAEDSDSED